MKEIGYIVFKAKSNNLIRKRDILKAICRLRVTHTGYYLYHLRKRLLCMVLLTFIKGI